MLQLAWLRHDKNPWKNSLVYRMSVASGSVTSGRLDASGGAKVILAFEFLILSTNLWKSSGAEDKHWARSIITNHQSQILNECVHHLGAIVVGDADGLLLDLLHLAL